MTPQSPEHTPQHRRAPTGHRWWRLAAAPVLVAAAVGGAFASGVTRGGAQEARVARPTVPSTTAPPAPLTVVSTTPAGGATGVDGTQPVTITFDRPVQAPATPPTVTPAVPGSWSATGRSLVFTPTGAFPPDTAVTVTVAAGLRSTGRSVLAQAATVQFRTGTASLLALDEALAGLHYLPLGFTASDPATVPTTVAARQRAEYHPPAGTFSWSWPLAQVPPSLAATWAPGRATVMVKGAVMAFEADHGLGMDGVAGPRVWAALTTTTEINPHGYTYALASKARPETLTVWHDGTVVEQTRANTGIPQAPTADGTFPVYERLASQVMKGTNPDGSHYADKVAWVAYFHGGDAVHFMQRAAYGFPQSLGCIELPYAQAKAVWPYLTFGTLVTVTG